MAKCRKMGAKSNSASAQKTSGGGSSRGGGGSGLGSMKSFKLKKMTIGQLCLSILKDVLKS